MKKVTLVLEYEMGDYDEEEYHVSLDPKQYEESFYQSDAFIADMKIVGVKVEDVK